MSFNEHPNVKEARKMEGHIEHEGPVGEVSHTDRIIREKILHVLSIYPRVSPSMLQVGVGTSLQPAIWKPLLVQLINEGLIVEELVSSVSPADRNQSYKVICLTENATPSKR